MKRALMTIPSLVAFAGCLGYQPFQPPPDEQERWKKVGATNTEIVKTLLECGNRQPRAALPYGVRKELPPFDPNDGASERHCMEADGYVTDSDNSWRGFCRGWEDENLPACASNAPIPKRSVSTRLNSVFCRTYPRADACSP